MNAINNRLLDNFVKTCDLFSDSVMMIQSGGGNGSTKFEVGQTQQMWIKASGYLMSDVTKDHGFATVSLEGVRNIMEDLSSGLLNVDDSKSLEKRMADVTLSEARPSIETFLHALLPQRYVLHVHSLITLLYASSETFVADLKQPLKREAEILLVPYEKPGAHLALRMKQRLNEYAKCHDAKGFPKAIILQNHGLIVASDDVTELESLVYACEDEIKKLIGLPSTYGDAYRMQLNIKHLMREIFPEKRLFVRLCEDKDLQSYEPNGFSFPDAVVFFGVETINQTATAEQVNHVLKQHLMDYQRKYRDYPRLIRINGRLYFMGESIKKCMEVQDVLKIQKLIDDTLLQSRVVLSESESFALLNWEAEKFRKNLG